MYGILTIATSISLLLASVVTPLSGSLPDVRARVIAIPQSDRGIDAPSTGVAISQLRTTLRESSGRPLDGVILANGYVPADSLASGVLQTNRTLLTINGEYLNPEVLTEIKRLSVQEVILLGGEEAISSEVETQLKQAGYAITRLAGPTRIETAQAIADFHQRTTGKTQAVSVARAFGDPLIPGSETADALAAGAYAAKTQTPTVLSPTDAMGDSLSTWFGKQSSLKTINIIGGPVAVSSTVEQQLGRRTNTRINRLSGPERASTAIAIADQYNNPPYVVVVDGYHTEGWKPAFQAAGLAADLDAPLLLLNGNEIPLPTVRFIYERPNLKMFCLAPHHMCVRLTTFR